MKKTMFITSIVMVVVLAVALTTSSLAWFAAGGSTQVTVTEFRIQARNNAAEAGLQLSNTGTGNWKTNSISLVSGTEGAWKDSTKTNAASGLNEDWRRDFVPLAPVGAHTTAAQLYTALRAEMYTSQIKTVNTTGTEQIIMESNPIQGAALQKVFYIRNTGEDDTNVTVTIHVNIADEQAARSYNATLWVALFDETGVDFHTKQATDNDQTDWDETVSQIRAGTVKLIAIACSDSNDPEFTAPTAAWQAGDLASTVNAQTMTYSAASALKVDFTLPAASDDLMPNPAYNAQTNPDVPQNIEGHDGILEYYPHTLRLIAWFDGEDLTNLNSDTLVSVDLQFDVANS